MKKLAAGGTEWIAQGSEAAVFADLFTGRASGRGRVAGFLRADVRHPLAIEVFT